MEFAFLMWNRLDSAGPLTLARSPRQVLYRPIVKEGLGIYR